MEFIVSKNLLIGAHMSIEGGYYNALYAGEQIGATVIQIFTANQRRWQSKKIDDEEIIKWKEAKKKCSISHIMSHASYLINLGSNKKSSLDKSMNAFIDEIKRCHELEIDYLTFHPGFAVGSTEEECLDKIIESLLIIAKVTHEGKTRLLLEITAGQGSAVGYKFEHLSYIIQNVKKRIAIGVCLDTCHTFAAGYDIRTKEGWIDTLKKFDEIIGLKFLFAFHLNDSEGDLGSRKDRHAPLGKGKIGWDSFKFLMSSSKTRALPKYLETPDPNLWEHELKMLKKFGEL